MLWTRGAWHRAWCRLEKPNRARVARRAKVPGVASITAALVELHRPGRRGRIGRTRKARPAPRHIFPPPDGTLGAGPAVGTLKAGLARAVGAEGRAGEGRGVGGAGLAGGVGGGVLVKTCVTRLAVSILVSKSWQTPAPGHAGGAGLGRGRKWTLRAIPAALVRVCACRAENAGGVGGGIENGGVRPRRAFRALRLIPYGIKVARVARRARRHRVVVIAMVAHARVDAFVALRFFGHGVFHAWQTCVNGRSVKIRIVCLWGTLLAGRIAHVFFVLARDTCLAFRKA